jgi:hypothetical protein
LVWGGSPQFNRWAAEATKNRKNSLKMKFEIDHETRRQILSNRIVFWIIILISIMMVMMMLSWSAIYQFQDKRAKATMMAIPTLTVEALETHYQKGIAYINIDQWNKAKQELEIVFEANPDYKDVQIKLRDVYGKVANIDGTATTISLSSPQEVQPAFRDDLSDGLIAYYPFNGNANDESGNDNHGVIRGPTLTKDRFGHQEQAFYFDGQGDFVEIPDTPALNPARLSISVWVMVDSTASSSDIDIISKDGETYQRQYLLTRSERGHFRAHIGQANGSFYWYDGSISPTAQQWYHLAQIWDGQTLELYVNGKPDVATYRQADRAGVIISEQPVRVGGGAPVGQLPLWFKGMIDDIRIYDRVLTQAEIEALYNEDG